jgi:hypothetical protein
MKFIFLNLLFSFISFAAVAQSKKAKDVLYRIEADGQAVYFGESLKLAEYESLEFDEAARLYVGDLELDRHAFIDSQGFPLEVLIENSLKTDRAGFSVAPTEIDASGEDGASGESGQKALDALKGAAGAHGSDGSHGSAGSNASDIFLLTPYLSGDVVLVARGGRGGQGGNGGSGGSGGAGLSGVDARVLFNFKGLSNLPIDSLLSLGAQLGIPVVGQVAAILSFFNGLKIGDGFDGFDGGAGGNAGLGGDGGNGGNGGNIELYFARRDKNARILVNTRAGAGGSGGRAGVPGVGGAGGAGGKAGDIWARDGLPGQAGAMGLAASAGNPGKPGKAGSIRAIETGDEVWLRCYVRYRQLIDLGMDSKAAAEILFKCSQ